MSREGDHARRRHPAGSRRWRPGAVPRAARRTCRRTRRRSPARDRRRIMPQPGSATTLTLATSGWSAAQAAIPSPVALAVESPSTMMRAGRDRPVGMVGVGTAVVVVVVSAAVVPWCVVVDATVVVGAARVVLGGGRRRRRAWSPLGRRAAGRPQPPARGPRPGGRRPSAPSRSGGRRAPSRRRGRARHTRAAASDAVGRHASRARRIGRSSATNDTTATAIVTTARRTNSGRPAEAGALLVEHGVDRPVVQVHAVADDAEADERSPRQRPPQR